MEEKGLTYQVIATVGGSMEQIVLFESKVREHCNEVCEDYMRSPRKASMHARNYLQYSWGSGIDSFHVQSKAEV